MIILRERRSNCIETKHLSLPKQTAGMDYVFLKRKANKFSRNTGRNLGWLECRHQIADCMQMALILMQSYVLHNIALNYDN